MQVIQALLRNVARSKRAENLEEVAIEMSEKSTMRAFFTALKQQRLQRLRVGEFVFDRQIYIMRTFIQALYKKRL